MHESVRNSVVVITGASSGIGRAIAIECARRGATLALAARRAFALESAAARCRREGATVMTVPTDTTDVGAVEALAQRAVDEFGRISVWINNAAVTLFARFDEAPYEDFRRVLDTNILGYVHGARAALPYFKAQRHGVLIDIASITSRVPQPYASAYVMSKQAVRALGMSLRQELLLDGLSDVHVCTVMPATIDTPLFQHAANYTGRSVQAMPPVYPARRVARAVVRLIEHPKREVVVGTMGRLATVRQVFAPAASERLLARQVERTHLSAEHDAPPSSGNLFEPGSDPGRVSGGWRQKPRTAWSRVGVGLALAAPVAAAVMWARGRDRAVPMREGPGPVLAETSSATSP